MFRWELAKKGKMPRCEAKEMSKYESCKDEFNLGKNFLQRNIKNFLHELI